MSLNVSYYGRLAETKPHTTFDTILLMELDQLMIETLKEMETKIKRHITECKHEVIKELQRLLDPNKEVKEQKYVRK